MAHEIETFAYTGAEPWHGLGVKVPPDLTPHEILLAANLDWTVEKQPLYRVQQVQVGDQPLRTITKPVPGAYGLVRSKDDSVLSVVGKGYKVVQPADAIDFFEKFTRAGKMTMETAGSLRHGRIIFALAKINKSVKISENDIIEAYLLLSCPYMLGYSLVADFTGVRVVCANTLKAALGSDLKGSERAYHLPHSQVFDEAARQRAEEALGLATTQLQSLEQAAHVLAEKTVSKTDVNQYFMDVIKVPADNVIDINAAKKRPPLVLTKLNAALANAPGANTPAASGTLYGALNAVTYVVDHQMGRTRDNGLASAWYGDGAAMKKRALTLALDMAGFKAAA